MTEGDVGLNQIVDENPCPLPNSAPLASNWQMQFQATSRPLSLHTPAADRWIAMAVALGVNALLLLGIAAGFPDAFQGAKHQPRPLELIFVHPVRPKPIESTLPSSSRSRAITSSAPQPMGGRVIEGRSLPSKDQHGKMPSAVGETAAELPSDQWSGDGDGSAVAAAKMSAHSSIGSDPLQLRPRKRWEAFEDRMNVKMRAPFSLADMAKGQACGEMKRLFYGSDTMRAQAQVSKELLFRTMQDTGCINR